MTDTGTCGHTEARTDGTTYGPCVLPRGHIQPDHQDAAGVRWGPLADLAEAWNSTAQHAARVLDALCAYLASAGQHAGIVAAASDEELRRTKGHAIAAKVRAEAAEERAEAAEDRLRTVEQAYGRLAEHAAGVEAARDRWRRRAEKAEAERERYRKTLPVEAEDYWYWRRRAEAAEAAIARVESLTVCEGVDRRHVGVRELRAALNDELPKEETP